MLKLFVALIILLAVCITDVLSQDSNFLLMGPSFGLNKSWRSYETFSSRYPTSQYQTNSLYGLEGSFNFFYKAKGKLGILGDLSFLKTNSSIIIHDAFSSEIEIKETSKWLTFGANIIYFPLPESKMLPFAGTGLSMAYLENSDLSIKIKYTNPDEQFKANRNVNEFRKNSNYFFKVVGGITINQFDKHRIVFLMIYSKTLGQFAQPSPPKQIGNTWIQSIPLYDQDNDYFISSITFRLMMAL